VEALISHLPWIYSLSITYSDGTISGIWYYNSSSNSIPYLVGTNDEYAPDGFTFFEYCSNGSNFRNMTGMVKTKSSYDPTTEKWYMSAYSSSNMTISNPYVYVDDVEKHLVVTAAKSIWSNGTFEAVAAVMVDLELLSESYQTVQSTAVISYTSWMMTPSEILVTSTSGSLTSSYADSYNILVATDSDDDTIASTISFGATYLGSWTDVSATIHSMPRKFDDPVTYLHSVNKSQYGIFWVVLYAFDYEDVYPFTDTSDQTLLILLFLGGVITFFNLTCSNSFP
jgi:hypothetical protein